MNESTRKPSSQHREDSMSMYFDFGTLDQEQETSFQTLQSSGQEPQGTPRPGGIRVSLACIQCRSRHVKCGAELPNCSRCLQDDKPCYYAKSRRGMRDRSAPHKRASLKEQGKASPSLGGLNVYGNDSLSFPTSSSTSNSYHIPSSHSSDASTSPPASSSSIKINGTQVDPQRLLDLYYNTFHKAHPWVLPRYYFLARQESDPDSLKHLLPVMHYIGSLYAPEITSSDLRRVAIGHMGMDQPSLPPTGFTVLALMIAAVALHGEDEFDQARSLLDRAIYMALEIRMNSRTFANMERDPILAESWRRTYWGLYITDAFFAGIRNAPTFLLYTVEANVEFPCEECEYEGIIPRPRTLSQYESRDFEEEEQVFSSFTYLIDITRISGSLLGIHNLQVKDMEPAVANADAMLVNWRLHLPKEKQGVVDKNDDVDELLFQAHNLLQMLMVHIHRPLSRLYQSPNEHMTWCTMTIPPPTRPPTSSEDRSYWLHTRKCLEAAEIAMNLYALPIPMLQHSPLGICGITISTLANLAACAYILQGAEWYRTRDRVRLGLGSAKKLGEVWSVSRKVEKQTKKIARAVFSMPRPETEVAGSSGGSVPQDHGSIQHFDYQMTGHGHVPGQMTGFENLGGLEYLSMLENPQSVKDWVHNS